MKLSHAIVVKTKLFRNFAWNWIVSRFLPLPPFFLFLKSFLRVTLIRWLLMCCVANESVPSNKMKNIFTAELRAGKYIYKFYVINPNERKRKNLSEPTTLPKWIQFFFSILSNDGISQFNIDFGLFMELLLLKRYCSRISHR